MQPIRASRTARVHLAVATTGIALALTLVAGCGSAVTLGGDPGGQASNSDIELTGGSAQTNGRSGDGGTPAAPGPGPAAPAQWVQLSSTPSPLGTVVTDVNGHTLYRFDEDKARPPTTNCSGPCATTWPPVTVQGGGKVFLDGTDGQAVGSVKRPDGTIQITVGGWPVYRFSGDRKPGDASGQGVKGTWFAVSPSGSKASTTSRSTGSPTTAAGPSGSAGSGSSSGSDGDAGSGAGTTALATAKSARGTVITDGSGRTLYVSTEDSRSPSRSHCASSQKCSGFTPARALQGGHVSIDGFEDSDLGTVDTADGGEQMTLDGYPLYTSGDDRKRGDITGDGRDRSWWALGIDSTR